MKPTHPAENILKYVTLGSCLRDIHVTAPLMAEMMSEFFTHRIIRADHVYSGTWQFIEIRSFRSVGGGNVKTRI